MKLVNPSTTAAPVGPYSHAVLTPRDHEWLHIAGQVGMAPDGSVPASFADQAHLCWRNLIAVLEAGGMAVENLVKVTTFVVDAADLPTLGPIRLAYLGEHRPAATLIVVPALARSEWKIEIEAVAARPSPRTN